MELVFFSSILLTYLACLLFIFLFLKIGKSSKTNTENSNLPPGPWKLPLIGNLHQLLGPLPHCALRDLAKKYGPLMHLQLGEISSIIVSSPEFAKEVMKTKGLVFASRPQNLAASIVTYNYSDIAFAPYGDCWRQLRKFCLLELLSMKRVQSLRSIREEEISSLINLIASEAGSVINLSDKVFSSMAVVTSRAAFGKKSKEQDALISAVRELMKLLAGFNVADLFPSIGFLQLISGFNSQMKRLHKKFYRILENIINERNCKPTSQFDKSKEHEALIDVFLRVQQQDDFEFPLTTENIKSIILEIFTGGSDTSSTTVDWAMFEMIKNPGLMRRAQAEVREVFDRKGKVDETGLHEIKLLKLVIKETLRLHAPVPLLLPRECKERCEINGFNVPAKTRVIINAWAIGRDPKYWTEPESFNPERFQDSTIDYKGSHFENIPFGAGRRMCPGISFALANVELHIAMLLYHFDWKLPNGMKHEDLNVTESFGMTVRRKDDLLLIPIPYRPLPPA